jgi:hypothetical protein
VSREIPNAELSENFPPTAGTVEYYRLALDVIVMIGCDYDGHDKANAESMRQLVDELVNQARRALRGEALFTGGPA